MGRMFPLLFIASLIFGVSCINNKDKDYSGDTESLYFDYKITAGEGDDNLTVLLQYRGGGEEGEAVPAGKVMLDDEVLEVDSTRKMTGSFYESHRPIAGFEGKHSIIFTGVNEKEYREEFIFKRVSLITAIADTITRDELVFEFDGLEPEDRIRILLTDTVFTNDGINREETVINGSLVVTRSDLESLANGPVQLEFIREYEQPVKNGTEEGGRLLITYSIKREFFLRD